MSTVVALALGAGVLWLGPPVKPPAQVKRVVSLAPSLTETVSSLGGTGRLVGVSRFDELAEVAALPRVGGYNDVAVERIVSLRPDLVLVQKSPGNQKPVETLARLGVTVVALPLTSVDDTVEAMTVVGRALGTEGAAKRLVDELQGARLRARDAAKTQARHPLVMLVYGFAPLVVAGPGSFAHELLTDCGVRNLAQASPTSYPTLPVEHVLALKPDVVIDAADSAEGKEVLKRVLPSSTRWVTLPTKDLLHPGPALARGVEQLCALLRAD